MMRFAGILLLAFWLPSAAHADGRFALLIGNQGYSEKVGPLKNPHNDIAVVGAALEKLGFKVTRIKDAGYREIDAALKRHIQQVRRAGKDTLSLVYYSGHGASDPDTQINYVIPVDITSTDDSEMWANSIDLKEIVNRLREQSPDAVHYVIFDACREELRLTREGKKALEQKGFVPAANIAGVMIAYATAPGKTASDTGDGGGVYAKTLAEEVVKPGVESVMMFRNVQLKVKEAIGQDPWLSFPTVPAVYFAGRAKPEGPSPERQIEIAFWESVMGNKDPAVLDAYLERYPKGEFAPAARALIAQYELQLAQGAAGEKAGRQQDEALKSMQRRPLKEERQAALAAEQQRVEDRKEIPVSKQQEDKKHAELAAGAEKLRQALEEIRIAREMAKTAEEQRLAAVRAAEEAKARAKLASLPPSEGQRGSAENLADDPVALARALQTGLKRVGCDPGELDGVWGAKAKDALANFARLANKTLPSDTPTSEALQAVLGQNGRICAPLSGAHQKRRDGPRAATAKDLSRATKSGGEEKTCGFGFGKGMRGGAGNRPGYGCR